MTRTWRRIEVTAPILVLRSDEGYGKYAGPLRRGGINLSEDGITKEVHTFTRYTTVNIKAGLYHCSLSHKTVTKPIIFLDFVNKQQYTRKFENAEKKWQP
jgi:hypothetical protein